MSTPVDAAAELARRSGTDRHDVAVVLGSGWAAAAATLGTATWEEPVERLPGFPAPTALGHGGTVRSLRRRELRVLLLLGRVHLYEGHPATTVTHSVRTAVAAGCRTVLLTNAAGGIRPGLTVGDAVLLSDQLDLTARVGTPSAPGTPHAPGTPQAPRAPQAPGTLSAPGTPHAPSSPQAPRAPQAPGTLSAPGTPHAPSSPYAGALRDLARRVDPALSDGVYAGLPGPHFETPAEIRALRLLGADLVGMSTVHEAAAAHAAGADVLGISLVSNLAAGVSPTPLSAEEVLDAGRAALPRLTALLGGVLDRLAAG